MFCVEEQQIKRIDTVLEAARLQLPTAGGEGMGRKIRIGLSFEILHSARDNSRNRQRL
jgi:hypothetical protein